VRKQLQALAFVFVFALASTAIASTQEKEKPASPPASAAASPPVVPLKVQITIGRFQGEKRLSSVPYTLSANTGGPRYMAHLRMGAQVPIASAFPGSDVKQVPSFQYKDVGTNIDCQATAADAGRFLLELTIEDSSVYPEDQSPYSAKGNPSFRSFRSTETVVLRDGQTTQFVAATDKLTGETVKVDVTLTVMK
jgi:hypothetical protein